MEKISITTGEPFIDIDGLACVIAYAELLKLEGSDADAVLTGTLNSSITATVNSWNFNYSSLFDKNTTQFVVVDLSDPNHIPKVALQGNIIELFDHHFGNERYWNKRLGKKSHIERIGACATLIWEEFVKRKRNKDISTTSANLLYTAIFSNTLNFKASVTTNRDVKAFNELKKYFKLPGNWIEKYFEEAEESLLENPGEAIKNDTKGTGEAAKKIVIGQIELWNSRKFMSENLSTIEQILRGFGTDKWFMTSPSISEGKNYLFTKNDEIKTILEKAIGAKFDGDLGVTNKLWLRKEIIKEL